MLALILLLLMRRLLFGTRPKIVVQHSSGVTGRPRPRRPLMRLVTAETVPDRPIEQGEMVYACAVSGANILRDMREAVVNTIGGHMTKYEALLDKTIARALEVLSERAREQGYDGVLGIRISHPTITSGAIEVVVAGTGFRYQGTEAESVIRSLALTPDPLVTHNAFPRARSCLAQARCYKPLRAVVRFRVRRRALLRRSK